MLAKSKSIWSLLAMLVLATTIGGRTVVAQDVDPNVGDAAAVAEAEIEPGDEADAVDDGADNPPAQVDDVLDIVDAEDGSSFARLIRIPLPITGNVDTRIQLMVDQVLSELPPNGDGSQRPTIVFEFWPGTEGQGDSSAFGRSLDLARYLASGKTSGVRTVAWIPETIRGHAVLVALACEQIVMHPDAKLGEAGIDETSIDPTVRRGYSEIAERRRTIPSAVALGMLDPALHVQRITTPTGVRYVLSDEVADIQQAMAIQSIDTVFAADQPGLLSGDKLRLDFGFVSHLATDRRELASALRVAASDLEIDPSLGGEWNAVRIDLNGPVTAANVNRIMRVVDDRLRADAVNFLCIAIDSPGGAIDDSIRLASYLSNLDSTKIRTVAYVADQARSDAALIALSCDQMVMHEGAILGGPGARQLSIDEIELASFALKEIALARSRNWSLPVAVIDADRAVFEYQMAGSTVVDYFCDEELQEQPDPARWQKGENVSAEGEALEVDGAEANRLRLARHVVSDYAEFQQRFQLEETPEVLESGWAYELVAALATPQVAAGLLFIGFFAMIAELSAPGVGIGGFLASVCFLLFFWSNFLQGTAGWLEVLLFLAGIVFIALEIFVLPGFGIFGLGGGILVLVSLVLASQTFIIPQNASQFEQLPRSMFTVVAAMAGVVVGGMLLRTYLEQSPVFRRFMLAPPEGVAAVELSRREAVVDYTHLAGKTGKATTPLVPAGKAVFGDEWIDVVSDGVAVERGATIEVIEVAGNRVVVREVT